MSERVAFFEETVFRQYIKLIAAGEIDAGLLDALQDFVNRQRTRRCISPGEIEMASWDTRNPGDAEAQEGGNG